MLDPACGSGTFVAEAVTHFIAAAENAPLDAREVLERLRFSIAGIDVHPVAVHLARAAWVLAARPAIEAAVDAGYSGAIAAPVYLGDALQMRFRTGDMFAEQEVTIQVEDDANSQLVFPVSLVDRAETFDPLMGDIADYVERGQDPMLALDDHGITDSGERETMKATIATLQRLHGEGRDHIWAYYTRNLVRPVALARGKVDVIIGNPPWLNYNRTTNTLRQALETLSKNQYGIWAGGRYATHQDVAGLFFARCVDLYLKLGGTIGMVMPHSALQTGQYSKWRGGKWLSSFACSVDFGFKTAWDLERLEPNTFFPVPASVVFAARVGEIDAESPLAGEVERWLGKAGAPDVKRERVAITDTSVGSISPYDGHSRSGSDGFPPLPPLCERDREPRHRSGRADGYRKSPAGFSGQEAVARPGPDRYHAADSRGQSPVRRAPGRDTRALHDARSAEGASAHQASRPFDSDIRGRGWRGRRPRRQSGAADARALADD